jgi:hypothetical protein
MSTIIDRGDWMQTFSGHQFFPLDPRPEDLCIGDIAHALSNLCRFGGHVREFYSVAQHSVIVSQLLPKNLKLAGLLHDATEAYLVDIPRPLKRALPEYKAIEHRLELVIAEKFGVDFSDPRIKRADNVALMTEGRDLLGEKPAEWGVDEKPAKFVIYAENPDVAREMFMRAFNQLTA